MCSPTTLCQSNHLNLAAEAEAEGFPPRQRRRPMFIASHVTLSQLVQLAFGTHPFQVQGAPSWYDSAAYEIDAKMDGSRVDALQKLSPHDQILTAAHASGLGGSFQTGIPPRLKRFQYISVDRKKRSHTSRDKTWGGMLLLRQTEPSSLRE